MAFDKREIPLVVLEKLEAYSQKRSELFRVSDKERVLLRLEDNHENPKFFFEIQSFENKQNKPYINLSIKPKSKTDPTEFKTSSEVARIDDYFKNWATHLKGYNSITLFDEPLLKQYQEEIYSEFEIIDDDADTASYDLKTQLWLEEHIDYALMKLEAYDADNSSIKLIKSDLEILKKNQTKLTKRKVIEALSKIYARARKYSLELLKEIYFEAKKELIKKLISGQIDIPLI